MTTRRDLLKSLLAGSALLCLPRQSEVGFGSPEFGFHPPPRLFLPDIQMRRFDIIERAQSVARAEIQSAEDRRIFELLDMAVGV